MRVLRASLHHKNDQMLGLTPLMVSPTKSACFLGCAQKETSRTKDACGSGLNGKAGVHSLPIEGAMGQRLSHLPSFSIFLIHS